jgi:hypothetical protein
MPMLTARPAPSPTGRNSCHDYTAGKSELALNWSPGAMSVFGGSAHRY